MDFYTNQHICSMFKISHQTVKSWSKEFAAYLSPTATPEAGKKRLFTDDDVRVFSLVHDYRQRGYTYADAHAAMERGQRGDIPAAAGEITPTAPPALITSLREEIASVRLQMQLLQSAKDKETGKVELLEKQLIDKEQRIERLYMQLAEERAKHRD